MKGHHHHFTMPRWLMERPYTYPLSLVCLVDAIMYGLSWWHPMPGVGDPRHASPLVIPWALLLGIGSLLIIVSRPLGAYRTESLGLLMLTGALVVFTAVAVLGGPSSYISAALFATLAFGTGVKWWTTRKAMTARRFYRWRGDGS